MFKTNLAKISCALVVALVVVSAASAVTTTHSTLASFLASTQPGFDLEDFSGVAPGPVASLSFGPVNGYSYLIDTPLGSASGLFNDPGLISTDNSGDMIQVTFTALRGNGIRRKHVFVRHQLQFDSRHGHGRAQRWHDGNFCVRFLK